MRWCPFRFGMIPWKPVGRNEEEDDDDDEGGTQSDRAEAANCTVRVAGSCWSDDNRLYEGRLLVRRHGRPVWAAGWLQLRPIFHREPRAAAEVEGIRKIMSLFLAPNEPRNKPANQY